MTATTAHIFTSAAGAKGKCDVCGKTRNVKAHEVATTVAEARDEMLPAASAAADDAEVADAMEAAGIEVADAEPDKDTVSVWVGRKIAEMAKAQKKGSLGAKFRAVTPSKAGDHTVRLSKAESEALAALATQVENQGGMMALSGRTLRARLDAAWNA